MRDKEFIDMMSFLISSDFEEYFEEEFESPFSREMANSRCPNYKKEPQAACYHYESHSTFPIYYKALNEKYLKLIFKRFVFWGIFIVPFYFSF